MKKFLFLFIIALLTLSGCSLWKQSAEKSTAKRGGGEETAEEEKIKDANSEAVKKGNNAAPQNVRSVDENDHLRGNINAPVKIIVYSDFECPYCARFADRLKDIEKEFGDKVVIVFRHFPLNMHPNAFKAALAAECAAEQEKFWEMHDKLFADNKAGDFNTERFKEDAAEIGLDSAQFNLCLDDEKYQEKVAAQLEEGEDAGVTGTPTGFINGEIVVGAYPLDDFTDSQGRQREGLRKIIQKYLSARQ